MKQKSFSETIHMESGLQEEVAKGGKKKTILDLLPKNLVLGIGCRKGISEEEIQSAVNEVKKDPWIYRKGSH